jgi:hypothetical protein
MEFSWKRVLGWTVALVHLLMTLTLSLILLFCNNVLHLTMILMYIGLMLCSYFHFGDCVLHILEDEFRGGNTFTDQMVAAFLFRKDRIREMIALQTLLIGMSLVILKGGVLILVSSFRCPV